MPGQGSSGVPVGSSEGAWRPNVGVARKPREVGLSQPEQELREVGGESSAAPLHMQMRAGGRLTSVLSWVFFLCVCVCAFAGKYEYVHVSMMNVYMG